MSREEMLARRVRVLTWLFMIGLVLSGATAIPLRSEVEWMVSATGAWHLAPSVDSTDAPIWAMWLMKVNSALNGTSKSYPFLFYGTDWLAFGHFAIAIAFIGPLRDPVRNRWLFDFGLLACALVIPYALIFGSIRGIPLWWRVIDSSFGVFGAVPLWFCRTWAVELEKVRGALR
jgi:hypothetical protein